MAEFPNPALLDRVSQMPKWASAPLFRLLSDQTKLDRLLHACTTVLGLLREYPALLEELDKESGQQAAAVDATHPNDLLLRLSKLTRIEAEAGFPTLHAQAAISLWAALEAAITTMLARWLVEKPQTYQLEALSKLRVRLGDWEGLSVEERAEHVINLLEQELGAPLKQGVGRFEGLLAARGESRFAGGG